MSCRATTRGVPPSAADALHGLVDLRGIRPADPTADAVGGALADRLAVDVHAAHPRLRGEGHEDGVRHLVDFPAADAVLLLGQDHDAASFGRFVGQAGKLRGLGQFLGIDAGGGDEFRRLAVAHGDRAGLVQQQHVHVAGGLHRAAAHGQHVLLDHAVDAGDADGREQPADRRRNQAHQQRNQHRDREGQADLFIGRAVAQVGVREDPERQHRDDDRQEDDRQRREQDRQGDFVGRLLPLGPFDQFDHAVHERLAGVGGHADRDLVGEHLGAAGDGRAVAAGFADHGGRFAGDGRFVDRGGAFDDLAVGGDQLAGRDDEHVALAERFGIAPGERCRRGSAAWRGSWCGFGAAFRPGPCRGPRPWPRRSWRRSR